MTNQEVAKILKDIAIIKQAKGANKFSIGSYFNAAKFVSNLPTPIKDIDLTNTKGIGPKISQSISEILSTGTTQFIEENKQYLQANSKLEELSKIEGIGGKTAQKIYDSLQISTIEELKQAIEDGRLASIFKEKTIENIRKGLEYLETTKGRIRLDEALELSSKIQEFMKSFVKKIEFCGSIRRRKSTVGDIDIVIIPKNSDALKKFQTMEIIDKVIDAGDKKVSVWIKGVRVDCYALAEEFFESGVMHLTGSAEHNAKLRTIAKIKGYKLSQYGMYKRDNDERIDNGTEKDIYQILGFEWIPPQHREGNIEFDKYKLGNKVETIEEITHDYHIHSTFSDGKSSIEENIQSAIKNGLKIIGIADHSKRLKIANGLTVERLQQKNKEIDELRKKYPEIKILKASEVDIKNDGTLDYDNEVLDELDVVIASFHTGTKEDITEAYKKAIQTRKIHIIGHITGRMINQRPGYKFDIEQVLQECKKYNVAIELNCQPNRLDADEFILKRCKELGVKVALGSDAHDKSQIVYVNFFGLEMAKRGWLTKEDLYDCKVNY